MNDDAARRAALTTRVSRAVRTYVRRRTEDRTGLNPEKFPSAPSQTGGQARRQYPPRWNAEQTDVARDAFLQMRSRRAQPDFVEYFTGSLCAYGQPLADADFRELADALLAGGDAWEDVRSLAMLTAATMIQPPRPSRDSTDDTTN